MSNLFFWIIILSFVIPMAMRMYRKSVARRNHEQSFSGRYPEQFPGAGQFPGSASPQNKQPRDGFTQQDYFAGGFRQIEQPQPIDNPQPLPYQYGQMPQPPVPGQDDRGFPQSMPSQPAPEQPAAPATPPPPSAPQGFRARKLAELDQQYSNGELSVEEYMTRRSEIMNG
ncbi:hypothetical protein CXX84_16340 [Arthrobacter sp. AFG7.2]|uniref:SHOCT domain-containing protein n=1 Tax=Arthrobacter sp. AFG7.2 TaxID=1688693 RepID=UPI000C9DBCEC|nr:SHOCT domain-containing protein [Arthrobacter sp. AFG7.2]PNI07403.1 hypothetical protein CXX84_16340 [Arthrobacter sp. AFG7.2]